MTFDQIRYFLLLADEGSFVRAARRCGISQPSLTNAIKSLETSLAASLFIRTVKRTQLTPFGEAIYPLLAQLDDARSQVLAQAAAANSSQRNIGNFFAGGPTDHD
jgi:DNA-binding transcriptional LysR family regulator